MKKIIVAGSRDPKCSTSFVLLKLNELIKKEIILLNGMCRGIDAIAYYWAKNKAYEIIEYPANWKQYNKAAGPIRNEIMAKEADALIAFYDGNSKGTKNMINLAKKYNLKIKIVPI